MHGLQPRILVVDDVRSIAHELQLLLALEGLPTVTANDLSEALAALREFPSIKVVIADVRLKAESGYQIPRLIQADADLAQRGIETLFMTGEAPVTTHRPPHSMLHKPLDIDQLISTFRALLGAGEN